jgi:hypothetical protein
MEYIVTSEPLHGKNPGEKFTEEELLAFGGVISKYLQAGRLEEAKNVSKAQPATQQVQKEEPKAPVFNTEYKEQGDK